MKKYPEDAVSVYKTFVEHSKRIEKIILLFQKEQERVYKKINELMESMAMEDGAETEKGGAE